MKNHVLTSVLNFGSRIDSRSVLFFFHQLSLDFGLDFLEVLSQVLTRNSRPKSGRDVGLDSFLKTWFGHVCLWTTVSVQSWFKWIKINYGIKRGNRNNTGNRCWDSKQKCLISPLILFRRIRANGQIEHFDLDRKISIFFSYIWNIYSWSKSPLSNLRTKFKNNFKQFWTIS